MSVKVKVLVQYRVWRQAWDQVRDQTLGQVWKQAKAQVRITALFPVADQTLDLIKDQVAHQLSEDMECGTS